MNKTYHPGTYWHGAYANVFLIVSYAVYTLAVPIINMLKYAIAGGNSASNMVVWCFT